MGASHSYQLRSQRRAWNANAAAAAVTKNPVCKHRSLPKPLWEHVQDTTARILRSMDNVPGRTHGMPQAVAISFQPLPPQACPALQLSLQYPALPQAWVIQRALISCCFNPFLSGQGTDVWGRPTHRSRTKTKAEHQELGKQRREREISPCSLRSSGLNPHKQPDDLCICGIPE